MNRSSKRFVSVLMILCITLAGAAGMADSWLPRFARFSRQGPPDTLVITGNFAKPRLLAEVAQMRGRATVLLINHEDGRDQLFFMESYPDAQLLPQENLVEFLAALSPSRVIILGDSQYVPERYPRIIRDRYPLTIIAGSDWVKNARALGDAVNDRRLVRHYRHYLAEFLDDQIKRTDSPEDIPMQDRIHAP